MQFISEQNRARSDPPGLGQRLRMRSGRHGSGPMGRSLLDAHALQQRTLFAFLTRGQHHRPGPQRRLRPLPGPCRAARVLPRSKGS